MWCECAHGCFFSSPSSDLIVTRPKTIKKAVIISSVSVITVYVFHFLLVVFGASFFVDNESLLVFDKHLYYHVFESNRFEESNQNVLTERRIFLQYFRPYSLFMSCFCSSECATLRQKRKVHCKYESSEVCVLF